MCFKAKSLTFCCLDPVLACPSSFQVWVAQDPCGPISFLSVGTFLSRLESEAATANTHGHHRKVGYLPSPMRAFATKGLSSLDRTSPSNLGS